MAIATEELTGGIIKVMLDPKASITPAAAPALTSGAVLGALSGAKPSGATPMFNSKIGKQRNGSGSSRLFGRQSQMGNGRLADAPEVVHCLSGGTGVTTSFSHCSVRKTFPPSTTRRASSTQPIRFVPNSMAACRWTT